MAAYFALSSNAPSYWCLWLLPQSLMERARITTQWYLWGGRKSCCRDLAIMYGSCSSSRASLKVFSLEEISVLISWTPVASRRTFFHCTFSCCKKHTQKDLCYILAGRYQGTSLTENKYRLLCVSCVKAWTQQENWEGFIMMCNITFSAKLNCCLHNMADSSCVKQQCTRCEIQFPRHSYRHICHVKTSAIVLIANLQARNCMLYLCLNYLF